MSHSHSWFGLVCATPFSNSNWVSPGMAESCWDVNCSLTSSTMVTQMKQLPCWKGVKFPSICPLSYGAHQSECFNITFSVIFIVNSLAINVCVWPSDDCGTSKVCSFVAGADAESSTRLLALEDGKAAGRNQIIGEFGWNWCRWQYIPFRAWKISLLGWSWMVPEGQMGEDLQG